MAQPARWRVNGRASGWKPLVFWIDLGSEDELAFGQRPIMRIPDAGMPAARHAGGRWRAARRCGPDQRGPWQTPGRESDRSRLATPAAAVPPVRTRNRADRWLWRRAPRRTGLGTLPIDRAGRPAPDSAMGQCRGQAGASGLRSRSVRAMLPAETTESVAPCRVSLFISASSCAAFPGSARRGRWRPVRWDRS